MKLLIIATVLLCYTMAQACEIQVWRGHKIHCCTNGTAIENASGGKVWVSQKPLICNESGNETAKSETSVLKVIIFAFIIVASALCCWWKCPAQKIRLVILRCCKREAAEEEDQKKGEVQLKVKKLPKSQSF